MEAPATRWKVIDLQPEFQLSMPTDVYEQDRQIRESGVLGLIQTELGLVDGLLHWAAINVDPCGFSELYLCAGFPEGEATHCSLRAAGLPLARNSTILPLEGIDLLLTQEQLKFLAALAIGREEYRLEEGRHFLYTGVAPVGEALLYPAGTRLEIEVMTFGHVVFREVYPASVPRRQVVPPAFTEIPTYPPS